MRETGISNEAVVDIRVPLKYNRASESYLEWIHIEVGNLGYKRTWRTQTIRGASIQVRIGDQLHYMEFATEDAPKEKCDLRRGEYRFVPVVVRATKPTVLYGLLLEPYICYVTDKPFLDGRINEAKLKVTPCLMKVIIHRDDNNDEVVRYFTLTIPVRDPISLVPYSI